jgi:hypothetical protein
MTTRFSLLTGTAALAAALGLTLTASGPASAQTNAPANQPPAASQSPPPATEGGAPSEHMGSMETHKMSHHASKGHMGKRMARSTDSGNAMVDKLNEQSLAAAQAGQTFNPGAGSTMAPAPAPAPAAPPPAPPQNKGM